MVPHGPFSLTLLSRPLTVQKVSPSVYNVCAYMNLALIQSALRERNLDAWLFYDHHHRDLA